MKRLAVALVFVVACGGPPIEGAATCDELRDQAVTVLADLEAESDAWWEQLEEVDERARELDCDDVAAEVGAGQVERAFDSVGD